MLYATVRQRKIYVKQPVDVIQNGINVDYLTLDLDDEWREMTSIVCVFTNGAVSKEVLHTFGKTILVPWECMEATGTMTLSVSGYVGSTKVMTTMLSDTGWNVVQNGPLTGTATVTPTPTLLDQVLAAAGAANTAAANADQAVTDLTAQKNAGAFNGSNGSDATIDRKSVV